MWDDVEEETPEVAVEEPAAEAGADGAAPADAPPEEAEPPAPEQPVLGYEPRKLVFRHWARPKINQYKYISNYRQNYYSDIISYLDKRNQGMLVEKPRAQTWGERALKTYLANVPRGYADRLSSRDAALLRHISTGARFHRYHSKSLISRKYSSLGFNTVSI